MASAVEYGANVDTITNLFARLSIEIGANIDTITNSLTRLSIESEAKNINCISWGGEQQSRTAQIEDRKQIKTLKIGIPSNKISLIEIAYIEALSFSQIQKELIKLVVTSHIKISVKDIIWIYQIDKWQIPGLKKQYIWVKNTKSIKVEYKHLLTLDWMVALGNDKVDTGDAGGGIH